MNKTDITNNIYLIQQKIHQQQQQQKKVDTDIILNINNNNKQQNVTFTASTSSPAPHSPITNTFNKNTSPTSASPILTINNNIRKNHTTSPISSNSTKQLPPTPQLHEKTQPPPIPPRKFVNTPPTDFYKPNNPPPPIPPKPTWMNKNNENQSKLNTSHIEYEYKKPSINIPSNIKDDIVIENNLIDNEDHEIEISKNNINQIVTPPTISYSSSLKNSNSSLSPPLHSPPHLSVTPPSIDSPQLNSPPEVSPIINICTTPPQNIQDDSPSSNSPMINVTTPTFSTPPISENSSPYNTSPQINSTEANSVPSISTSGEYKLPSSSNKPPRDPNSSPILVKRSVSIVENLNQKSSLSPNSNQFNNVSVRRVNTNNENTSGSIAPPPSPTSSKININQGLSTSLVINKTSTEESPNRNQRVLSRRVASSNLLQDPDNGRANTFVMSNSSYNLRGDSKDDDDDVDTTNIIRRPNSLPPNISKENSPPPTPSNKHQRTHSYNSESPSRDVGNYSASSFNLRDSFEKIIPGLNANKNEGKLATIIEKIETQNLKIKDHPTRKSKLPKIDSTTKLNKRIVEMIETEADYIDDLEICLNLYLYAFSEMEKLKIITPNDIRSIFSNIEELYHVSLKLFPMLLKTIPLLERNEYPNIEEIFLNNYKAFQRYGYYLSSYESSNKYLENLIEKNEIVKYVIEYIKNQIPMSKLLNLHAYQIKPCQRLCKYPLLLKDAKSSVPESEEQHHKQFERAVKLMEKIVNDINGKITNDEKIQTIVKELGKEIETLIHHQTFLKEGKLKKIKNKNQSKEIHVYLLDQYIILYEKGTFKKKYKTISFSKVSRICDHEARTPNSFGVYYSKDGGPTKTLLLQLETNKEKTDWMNLFDESLHSYKYISGDKFLYITNNDSNNPKSSIYNTIRPKSIDKDKDKDFTFF